VILIAMAVQGSGGHAAGLPWSSMGLRTLLLGPAAGVAVGLAGIGALELVRRRVGVRRDYESIYSLGIAFLAFAAGEGLHGSGLLAAFAAGLTIALLDVELCDCFLEYGQTTAEMALLFTFVLLGSGPIWTGFDVLDVRSLAFAVVVLLARPAAFIPSLALSRLDARSRWMIAWFGPRGLSSLLLALLPVFAGMPGSDRIFSTCCLVVLLSIAVHGGSVMLLGRGSPSTPAGGEDRGGRGEAGDGSEPLLVEVDELRRLVPAPVLVDARTERSRRGSGIAVAGAVRLDPDSDVARRAEALGLPKEATLAVFCA
jgi:NhaP-type Na+/H+ or K+/H+ antiporter